MDFGKAFSYISEDESWSKKLGIGAVVFLVPILNFAAFGFILELIQNVWQGKERPLPAWDNFGNKLLDGLRFFAVVILYSLPMFILFGIFVAVFMGQLASYDYETAVNTSNYATSMEPLFFIGWAVMAMCLMPYYFFVLVMYPMFFIQLVRHRTVKSCFDFKEMWHIVRHNPGEYLIILGIMFGLYMASAIVTFPLYIVFLIPCIGFIIGMLVSGAMYMLIFFVFGHLAGQFVRAFEPPEKPIDDALPAI